MKKVVYGCITGGYDNVPVHKYVAPDWDYILFTDNADLIADGKFAHWTIKPLVFDKLDNVKNARWHKVNAHKLFPEYEYSLWLDSNILVNNENLFVMINDLIEDGVKVAVPNHPERKCIYDEADVIKQKRIDFPELVDVEMDFLRMEKYPKNNGLAETGVLLRAHNDIIPMLNLWWNMIEKYSKRDQLSFNYALWKKNIKSVPIYTGPDGFGAHRKTDDLTFVFAKSHNQDKIFDKRKCIPKTLGRVIACLIPIAKYRRMFRDIYVKDA